MGRKKTVTYRKQFDLEALVFFSFFLLFPKRAPLSMATEKYSSHVPDLGAQNLHQIFLSDPRDCYT